MYEEYKAYRPRNFKRYAVYARKSEVDEGRQERSIDDQNDDCKKLLAAEKIDIKDCDFFEESQSAKKPHRRPIFRAILDEFDKPNPKWDGIIAWHPNRLARNALEAGEIIQMLDDQKIKDLKFYVYRFHNDSSGKEHLMIEFARAKGYSDQLSDVVTRSMVNMSSLGNWIYGTPKYGYKKVPSLTDKKVHLLVPHEIDFFLMQEAFQMRLREKTYQEIADFMNARGSSRKMTKQKVEDYIKDTFYYGLWVIERASGKTDEVNMLDVIDYEFKPVVSRKEWDEAARVNDKRSKGANHRRKWLLAGKVTCSGCGGSRYPNEPSGKGIFHFTCQNKECPEKGGTNLKNIIFPVIEDLLKDGLGLSEKEYKKALFAYKVSMQAWELDIEQTRRSLLARKAHAKKEMETELNHYAALANETTRVAELAKKQAGQKIDDLDKEITKYSNELKELEDEDVCVLGSLRDFLELSKNALTHWQNADEIQKRKICEILFSNLTVSKSEVASVSLNEPFCHIEKLKDVLSGRGSRTRTCGLSVPNRAQ